jgi:hypothetical protein
MVQCSAQWWRGGQRGHFLVDRESEVRDGDKSERNSEEGAA